MGTNIHAVVQRRESDKWVNVDMTRPGRPIWDHPLLQRNYDAFAILGNVRNGRGFAGIYTSDGFEPISSDRGLPEDFDSASDEGCIRCSDHAIKPGAVATLDGDEEDPAWDCDTCVWMGDHSFTWVTARELIDYDWDAPVRKCMVIDWKTYEEWAIASGRQGFPRSWCGDVGGLRVRKITEDELDQVPDLLAQGLDVYVIAYQSYPRREAAKALHGDVLPWLQTLGDPDDVRIVMGFDS